MANLSATFGPFKLNAFPLMAESSVFSRDLSFCTSDAQVAIRLTTTMGAFRGHADTPTKRFFFDLVTVDVRREMPRSACESLFKPQGDDGLENLNAFNKFLEIRHQFQAELIIAMNRLIEYFKFRLRGPELRLFSWADLHADKIVFFDPAWSIDGAAVEQPYGAVGQQPNSVAIPGRLLAVDDLGIQRLVDGGFAELEEFLAKPRAPDLVDETLSDGQTAALSGNVRRAVLELAIAAEAMTRGFFDSDEKARSALKKYKEGLEPGQDDPGVIRLLSKVAYSAFGRSFKLEFPDDFDNFELLFRGRNKIAHRAEANFSSVAGIPTKIDMDHVKVWWRSFAVLEHWLASLGRTE